MALRIGELVGMIQADDSGMRRGLANAELRMRGFRRDVESNLRQLHDRFRNADIAGGLRSAFDRLRPFGQGLARIAGMAGRLGGVAMSIGGIAAKLGAAVPVAAGLAAAIGQIAPAAGLAVTGLFAIQLASNAVKLGMVGVSDAVSAALDPDKAEEFEKAVSKLAPEAQKFARGIKALAPQFRELQQTVQNRLFKGLDGVLKGMATDTLPVLRTGLMDASDSLNLMAKGVGHSARSLARNGTLGTAIAGANAGLRNLSRAPGQFLTALTQVGAAAAPAFGRLTAAAGKAMDRFSQRFTNAFKSGALERAIEQAIALIGDLAEVAANVFRIIGQVFKAAQTSGGGFIGVLQTITDALADAFASPEIQAGLKALFGTMSQLAKSAAPILVSVLKTVAGVFEQLGPPAQELIKHLGAGLLKIVQGLSPVLVAAAEAVGQLVVAALPLIDVAAELVAALLPALVPLLESMSKIIQAAAPFVAQLAATLSAMLMPILTALAQDVLPKLLPPFVELAEKQLPLLSEALVELTPGLVDLGLALADLLIAATPLIVAILELVVALADELLPILTPVIVGLAMLVSRGLQLVANFLTNYAIPIIRVFTDLLSGDFSGAVRGAGQIVAGMAANAIRAFTSLRDRAGQAITSLGRTVSQKVSEIRTLAVMGFARLVGDSVARIRELPGMIRGALSGAGGLLVGIGRSIIQGLINGVRSKISELIGTFNSITSSIPDWKGPAETDARLLVPAGQKVMAGFQRGIRSQLPALRSQLQGITGGMPGMALAGAPGDGYGAAGGGRVVLEVRSDGSRYGDFLVEEIRRQVDIRGGDPGQVLTSRRR